MGSEFGQWHEWRDEHSLDWHLLEQPAHRALLELDRDLNHIYRAYPQLHASDTDPAGFAWIDLHNADQSVFAFLRRWPQQPERSPLVCVFNCTPVPRDDYGLGVPAAGTWRRVLDTDASRYGGSDYDRRDRVTSQAAPAQGYPCHVRLNLPPLAAVFLELER
jgi:1,4-alpha-glucan branching enzyme